MYTLCFSPVLVILGVLFFSGLDGYDTSGRGGPFAGCDNPDSSTCGHPLASLSVGCAAVVVAVAAIAARLGMRDWVTPRPAAAWLGLAALSLGVMTTGVAVVYAAA